MPLAIVILIMIIITIGYFYLAITSLNSHTPILLHVLSITSWSPSPTVFQPMLRMHQFDLADSNHVTSQVTSPV